VSAFCEPSDTTVTAMRFKPIAAPQRHIPASC
jgi:hypothetical protein